MKNVLCCVEFLQVNFLCYATVYVSALGRTSVYLPR
jgi:hypothetical protein